MSGQVNPMPTNSTAVVKEDLQLIVLILLGLQLILYVWKYFYGQKLKKHYNKANAFRPCDWLVETQGPGHDKCSNLRYVSEFERNGNQCKRAICNGFLPKDKDFDALVKKTKLYSKSNLILEIVLNVLSCIALFISILKL